MSTTDQQYTGLTGRQIGNYKATQLLGKGSMGEVYRGKHPILDRQVAIKVLPEELTAHPEIVSRFRREARAVTRIKHPTIVQVFDFGELEDGRQYFVMELLTGSNLHSFLASRGQLPLEVAMAIALPLMDGFGAAHEAGFIHRDIKPDNIFLVKTDDGMLLPKVIDFGIAKLKDPDGQGDSVVTRMDAVMGTPLYMSPEQTPAVNEEVGPWSDIYSLGATVYHMMAGRPPFISNNPLELMLMHSSTPPPMLSSVRGDLPFGLTDVLLKAMAKKPSDRFQTMAEFAEAMREGANTGVEPPPDRAPPESPDTLETATTDPDGDPPEPQKEEPEPPQIGADAVGAKREPSVRVDSSLLHAVDEEELEAGSSVDGPAPALTSLSGAASEQVIVAEPPGRTLFAPKAKSRRLIYLALAAFALGALAAVAVWYVRRKTGPAGNPVYYQQLASKTRHTCAVNRTDGSAWCWGRNSRGQLGDGTTKSRASIGRVDRLKGVVSVTAGGRHSCAALRDGTAWCWGKNSQGQLGDGTQRDRHRPVMVAELRQVRSVHAGAEHSCALLRNGSVWCWGWNVYGQLGDGTIEERRLKPVKVTGSGPVAQLDTGGFHTCAVNRNGRVWCWGKNDIGQVGAGDTKNHPRPTQVKGLTEVTSLSAGGAHTCAVNRDGSAWCWGNNESGELGDGSSERRTAPVKVQRLSGLSRISAGGGYLGGHTCAVKRSGTAWCWGNNLSGQLGQGSITQNRPFPGRVSGLSAIAMVVASGRHSCAVAADGRVWCWGKNEDGQLGDSTRTDRPRPVQLRQ